MKNPSKTSKIIATLPVLLFSVFACLCLMAAQVATPSSPNVLLEPDYFNKKALSENIPCELSLHLCRLIVQLSSTWKTWPKPSQLKDGTA